MDYRKDVRTPRDRVDDAMLRLLLNESEENADNLHGCGTSADARLRNRSGRRSESQCKHNCLGLTRKESDCGMEKMGNDSRGGMARGEIGDSCSCIDKSALSSQVQGLPLVMSYAPDQDFHLLYEDDDALANGTLFSELNLPFYGTKCGENCSSTRGLSCKCND